MSTRRPAFLVMVDRIGDHWGLTVPDAPGAISLVRNLAQADAHIREAIAYVTKLDPADFGLQFSYRLPGHVEKDIADARSTAAHAEQLQREAAERLRHAVSTMHADGISGADMSRILEVSPQRVSQLMQVRSAD